MDKSILNTILYKLSCDVFTSRMNHITGASKSPLEQHIEYSKPRFLHWHPPAALRVYANRWRISVDAV